MTGLTSIGGQAATMTSREIADLVEARHNDVVTTIERLFDKGLYDQVVKLAGSPPVAVRSLCMT